MGGMQSTRRTAGGYTAPDLVNPANGTFIDNGLPNATLILLGIAGLFFYKMYVSDNNNNNKKVLGGGGHGQQPQQQKPQVY